MKKAYRKLAIANHPDKNLGPGQDAAAERFRRVSEAYEILGDKEKRATYERDSSGWGGSTPHMQYQAAAEMYRRAMESMPLFEGDPFGDGDWWARFDARNKDPFRPM